MLCCFPGVCFLCGRIHRCLSGEDQCFPCFGKGALPEESIERTLGLIFEGFCLVWFYRVLAFAWKERVKEEPCAIFSGFRILSLASRTGDHLFKARECHHVATGFLG